MAINAPTAELQTCRVCGRSEPDVRFGRYGSGSKRAKCHGCMSRQRRATPEGRAKQNRYQAAVFKRDPGARRRHRVAWELKNRERILLIRRVGNQVLRAIERGDLIRPDTCEECGATAKTQAAHHDYSRPLEVRWLCPPCHVRWDHHDPKTKTKTEN